jgi:uncharacterized protein YcbK (DUF882 family)
MSHHRFVGRRCFLKMSAAAVATALSPVPVFAGFKQLLQDERRLHFYNLHTDERLQVCYCRNGKYDRRALKAVDHILRDHRTDKVHPIEPRLLDLLHAIAVKTGSNRFHVISGYRSPTTNAMLRKDGRKVASRSYHTRGKAIDIRMPDADTRTLYRVTVDLKGGGAGHYAGRNFVHVDVGPVRYW